MERWMHCSILYWTELLQEHLQSAFMFYRTFTLCSNILNAISNYTSSRDSAVGIATGYGLNDRGVRVPVSLGSRIFSSPRRLDRLWGPPNLLSNGYGGSFPGVKQPVSETDHSPPTSAEIKKMWIYTTTSPYAFMAQYLIS
jgi:hypothetical protein